MGVRRALDIVLAAANKGDGSIYTYGPLIHNPQAIELLRSRGIEVLNEIPEGFSQRLVIRTHGISPEKRRQLKAAGAKICDATCPRVAKVQSIIKKYVREGYSVIIVGDRNHPEVLGLLGFADGKGTVIEHLEDIETLTPQDKLCVVAQTTQYEPFFQKVASKLKEKFPSALIFDTICDSTLRRQAEVLKLAQKVDFMIVVGGEKSANTARLAKLSQSVGTPTIKIETEEELNSQDLKKYRSVGVTAGASTPNWMINRVLDKVESLYWERKSKWIRFFSTVFKFLIKSNIYVALGAASLSYASCRLQQIEPSLIFHFIAGFYVFAMHILNHFTDREAVKLNEPARSIFYDQHKILLIFLGIFSALGALVLSLKLGLWSFTLVAILSIMGILYRIKIVPQNLSNFLHYRSLKEIPASKDLFLTLAWTMVTVILPAFSAKGFLLSSLALVSFLFILIIVFIRSVLYDIKDIQGDMIVGKETIPIVIGKGKTKVLLVLLALILAIVLFLAPHLHWTSTLSYYLLIPVLYTCFYLFLYHRRIIWRGVACEATVDTTFILTGLVTYLWILFSY